MLKNLAISFFITTICLIFCIKAIAFDGYVLPDSASRTIGTNELINLTPWQLKVARNEIYARHGRSFKSGDLRCYFQTQSWYNANPNYSDNSLNGFERKNAVTILNYEKQIKSLFTNYDNGCEYGRAMASDGDTGSYYENNSYYLLSDSNKRNLTTADFSYLSPWQLKAARNEIYARHGRKFQSADLRCYFQSMNWYQENPNYSDKLLNGFEQRNAVTILNYEKQIGSKATYKDNGCEFGRNQAGK